jgi:hypothetical protein
MGSFANQTTQVTCDASNDFILLGDRNADSETSIVPATDDRWWWLWRNWWNEDWQGKPKYSEKTCPSATLSITNPTRLRVYYYYFFQSCSQFIWPLGCWVSTSMNKSWIGLNWIEYLLCRYLNKGQLTKKLLPNHIVKMNY